MNHRELRLAAFVGISSSLATAFLLTGIGSVQAVGPAPSLQTLHDRVRKLETQIAADEQEQSSTTGKNIANRVRAPFVVVDAKDRPIVTIDASGDTHLFKMGTLGSGTAIQLERGPEHATVVTQLGSSDTQARVGVREGRGPRLEVYTRENSTIVGVGANNRHGIFLRDGGGGKGQAPAKVLGELAVNINESGGIVRLYDKSAQPVFSVGGNYKEGGRGQLTLSSPGKNAGMYVINERRRPWRIANTWRWQWQAGDRTQWQSSTYLAQQQDRQPCGGDAFVTGRQWFGREFHRCGCRR